MKEIMVDAAWEAINGDETFGADTQYTMTMNMTYTFNSAAKTVSTEGTMTMVFSGSKVAELWNNIINVMLTEGGTDNGNHSVTITMPPESYVLDANAEAQLTSGYLEINQNGTKIRMSAEITASLMMDLPPGVEISPLILIKQ